MLFIQGNIDAENIKKIYLKCGLGLHIKIYRVVKSNKLYLVNAMCKHFTAKNFYTNLQQALKTFYYLNNAISHRIKRGSSMRKFWSESGTLSFWADSFYENQDTTSLKGSSEIKGWNKQTWTLCMSKYRGKI